MKKNLLALALVAGTFFNAQSVIFTEGFEDVAALSTQGWTNTNQSEPAGPSKWGQGVGQAFNGAQAGSATSFALCNFNSVASEGIISNWLITPVLSVKNNDVISFYTRKGGTTGLFPDRLELRISNQGSGSALPVGAEGVGSFTTLAVSVNPDLTVNTSAANGYPLTWTQYSYTVTGLPADTDLKVAFRYFVTDGGDNGANSNIIGIDTFAVNRPQLAVSENASKQNLSVYPTLAEQFLNIETQNGLAIDAISIYDLSGRSTGAVKADVKSKSASVVDVSTLKPGAYIVSVLTKEGTFTAKIMKK